MLTYAYISIKLPLDGLRADKRRKRASTPPSRHGSGSALSATGNRLGDTPRPPSL
ncbi:hypothetical protein ABHF97_005322 [Escherichia coli]|uniref:hypothetical protein n=1 Tax=Escherichia coli TaxID=562 RepID=UPI0028DE9363|nr:hypothetical protein [Escherichia coli]HEA1989676.1 hypothetical protein [Escherichia coli]